MIYLALSIISFIFLTYVFLMVVGVAFLGLASIIPFIKKHQVIFLVGIAVLLILLSYR